METTQNKTDHSGYLSDDQLMDLGRLKNGLDEIDVLIDHVNLLVADTGLPLRPIPTYHAKLMANDISMLSYTHQQAVQRIQDEAIARMAA